MNTATPTNVRPAKFIRLIHGAMIAGIVIFAILNIVVIRPARASIALPATTLYVLLGVSVVGSAASLLLRGRVPRRNSNDSEDLFWTTAAKDALILWSPLEMGALLGLAAYMLSGAPSALVVAAIGLLGMIAFNPGRLERS